MTRNKRFRSVRRLFTAALLAGLTACGGGGGGTTETPAPTLSRTGVFPGEFIVVNYAPLTADTPAVVAFTDPQGYRVEVTTEDTGTGVANVAVPVYLDPGTGESAEAVFSVEVDGVAVPGGLTVRALPALETEPGQVYARLLEKTVENYQSTATHLAQITADYGVDMSAASDEVAQRTATLTAMIAELRGEGRLTLEVNEGETVVLEAEDLRRLDQWLTAWIFGMDASMAPATARRLGDSPFDNWLETTPEERLEAIQESIDNVVSEFKRGLEGGKVWIGGMTVAFAGAGMLVGGPAGAAVGAAAGLALAYFSAGYELGTAAIYDRVCESFSTASREVYDWGEKVLGQVIRIAASAAGGIESAAGKLASLLSTGITLNDTMEAAENVRCGTPSEKTVQRTAFESLTDEFCSAANDDPIIKSLLSARIRIPGAGYDRDFEPGYVMAGFGTIEDGDGNLLLGGIPTVVGSDLAPDAADDDQNTLLFFYVHPDLALTGSGPWTVEIAEPLDLADGARVELFFFTTTVRNDTPLGDPVFFVATSGTMTFEAYGTGEGDLVKGSFDVVIQGELEHRDEQSDTSTSEVLNGTITGTFDAVLTADDDGDSSF